jgi:transcriptional regulator with XRE-family HTH domain
MSIPNHNTFCNFSPKITYMKPDVFWDRVNVLIKRSKTTQRVLSMECGFTARRIESLVSAGRIPDGIETYRIAQALGTTVEYLISGQEPTRPDTSVAIQKAEDLLDALKKL